MEAFWPIDPAADKGRGLGKICLARHPRSSLFIVIKKYSMSKPLSDVAQIFKNWDNYSYFRTEKSRFRILVSLLFPLDSIHFFLWFPLNLMYVKTFSPIQFSKISILFFKILLIKNLILVFGISNSNKKASSFKKNVFK